MNGFGDIGVGFHHGQEINEQADRLSCSPIHGNPRFEKLGNTPANRKQGEWFAAKKPLTSEILLLP
jgi:hypothetical protein